LCAQIHSTTNFPVASGLASSAAGFAAIAFAFAEAYGLDEQVRYRNPCTGTVPQSTIILARLGSGSASRSISAGLQHWESADDGSPVVTMPSPISTFLVGLRAVIVVLDAGIKEIPSSIGMQLSVCDGVFVFHVTDENLGTHDASTRVGRRARPSFTVGRRER